MKNKDNDQTVDNRMIYAIGFFCLLNICLDFRETPPISIEETVKVSIVDSGVQVRAWRY